ncbi:taste receptor type 2 member 114-like [Engystomops pustulosus]|uniref:taste receptor type 2 member 114-like n=1 Tax=Engystomops pustulosus TaxID=76066 RepID=UPI003AFA42D6
MSCNVWFSTFLCVYFCLKIVNVKNTLYICLQRNFQKVFPRLFISAILGSVLVCVPFILKVIEETSAVNMSTINKKRNLRDIVITYRDSSAFIILSWTALLILSISALAIVTSLFKHMNQVQENFGGFRSPNMKAHVQALKTIIFFLLINFLMLITATANITLQEMTLHYVIIPLYSVTKAMVCWSLIKGNWNLDKTMRNILRKLHYPKKFNDKD